MAAAAFVVVVFGAGAAIGAIVGAAVGEAVGAAVCAAVGVAVGAAVGAIVAAVGAIVAGATVGDAVGASVGATVGAEVGATVGAAVGAAVGATVDGGSVVGCKTLIPVILPGVPYALRCFGRDAFPVHAITVYVLANFTLRVSNVSSAVPATPSIATGSADAITLFEPSFNVPYTAESEASLAVAYVKKNDVVWEPT